MTPNPPSKKVYVAKQKPQVEAKPAVVRPADEPQAVEEQQAVRCLTEAPKETRRDWLKGLISRNMTNREVEERWELRSYKRCKIVNERGE